MSQTETDKITVSCSCGKKLKAPASAVGRKAKCPGCGNVMTLTAPTPTATAKQKKPAPPPVPADDGLDGLYALAAEEKQAAKHQGSAADDGMRCPSCGSPMEVGAVLCVSCGFDMRTKSKATAKKAAVPIGAGGGTGGRSPVLGYGGPASKKEKVADALAPQGKFVVGLGLSVLFAIGGAIVWFLFAFFTGYELFFLALVVGGAAGVGMQYGQQGYSTAGGLTAAAVTFGILVLAKIAIFVAVLIPLLNAIADPTEGDEVTEYVLNDELRKQGVDPDSVDDEQYDEAAETARKKAKKLTEAERKEIEAKIQKEKDRDELIGHVQNEIMQTVDMDDQGAFNYIRNQANKRVSEMSEPQQAQALAQYRQKAKAERDAAMAEFQKEMAQMQAQAQAQAPAASAGDEDAEEDDDESVATAGVAGAEDDGVDVGSAAKAGFFLLFIYLLIDWKGVLFMLGAMFFAYRTAAGAVHD